MLISYLNKQKMGEMGEQKGNQNCLNSNNTQEYKIPQRVGELKYSSVSSQSKRAKILRRLRTSSVENPCLKELIYKETVFLKLAHILSSSN